MIFKIDIIFGEKICKSAVKIETKKSSKLMELLRTINNKPIIIKLLVLLSVGVIKHLR